MSQTSSRLSLPYLAEAQAQKHVTVNEGLRRLDALVHLSVLSMETSVEPTSPTEDDAYILPAGASGTHWDSFAETSAVVFQDGAWESYSPKLGMTAYVADLGAVAAFDGTGWKLLNEPGRLGINTSADGTNKLAVKSDAVLISHDDVTPGTGDVRLVMNKSSATATASIVFQTAFGGRAEFGLTGSDDFTIKVADDQGTFRDAITINRQTGAVSFPNTP